MIKVLLVDDHKLVRAGLQSLLATTDDIAVVGTAADGSEAIGVATATDPDVVLMDLSMPRDERGRGHPQAAMPHAQREGRGAHHVRG